MTVFAFRNPQNGFEQRFDTGNAIVLVLFAAPLYFAAKGVWTHALVSFVMAIVTFCFSNIAYAYFATRILKAHYQRKGWHEVTQFKADYNSNRQWVFLAGFVVFLLVMLAFSRAVSAGENKKYDDIVGNPYVIDGDTLAFGDKRVRLIDIDAPELKQECYGNNGDPWPCGRVSAARLKGWIEENAVRCEPEAMDKYHRFLAECWVVFPDGNNEINLNHSMIVAGWAVAYRDRGRFLAEAKEAHSKQSGIWKGFFTMPWEHRK